MAVGWILLGTYVTTYVLGTFEVEEAASQGLVRGSKRLCATENERVSTACVHIRG